MPSLNNPQSSEEIDKSQNNAELLSGLKTITDTLGDSGTRRFSGFFSEEPNVQWRDDQRITNVEEMRRTDGTVKAVLNAIKAPILSVDWDIEGNDEKIVKFVKSNLFGMRRTWRDFLREAFAYLDFGYYVFELIFEKKGSKFILIDLQPRIPRSIFKWRAQDESGKEVPGITQMLQTDEVESTTAYIPMQKLLVLTNDKEGDDVTGQSILRPGWKHYKMKDVLERVQAIAAERYGVGIPVITLPKNFGPDEKAKAEELGRNVRSNEKNYIVLPSEEWKFMIATPTGNPQGQSIESAIKHHSNSILISILATFLGLGTNDTGSMALSRDQSSFFLKHVEDKCSYFAEQITEQVIRRLVYINFGPEAEIPKLKFAPLGDIDFGQMATTLKTLNDSALIEATPRLKQFVARVFKLPEITDDEKEALEEADMEAKMQEIDQASQQDEYSFIDQPDQGGALDTTAPEDQATDDEAMQEEDNQPA